MSTPLNADQMLAALHALGLTPTEHKDWRNHNRNHRGPWGPVYGIVIHHTAGVSGTMRDYVYNGTEDLPGPVCHAFLSKAAALYLIGNGRANHAGTIAINAFDAIQDESPVHPRPDASEPLDGNRSLYGIEIENRGDGKDPYPVAQYDAAVKWAAAICIAHGWTANSVVGHKEVTRRKIDPSFDMDRFRADVAEVIRIHKIPTPKPAPKPAPPKVEYITFPGTAFFRAGRVSPTITRMGEALVRAGYKGYRTGPGPIWTNSDRAAYAWWQRHLGYTGSDADGTPGHVTWDRLRVRKGK
jgi:hypothetical protein